MILDYPEGKVVIKPLTNGKNNVNVILKNNASFLKTRGKVTNYPANLIKIIADVKTPVWVVDEIIREEERVAVYSKIKRNLLGHLKERDFVNSKILDFGSGCGSSTLNLARLFPKSFITGIELDQKLIAVAKARTEFYKFKNINYLHSPDGSHLPEHVGKFDFINLNAVFEHLYPNERAMLLPQLWSLLKPKGVLFFSETPYRYSIFDYHSTGLPFINFLPDFLVYKLVHKYSKIYPKTESWKDLLRNGLRGGTKREIMNIIKKCKHKPILLESHINQISNGMETWYISFRDLESCYTEAFKEVLKKFEWLLNVVIKRINWHLKVPPAADLSIAIQKSEIA